MSALDTLSGIAIGAFLVKIVISGKTGQLITLAKRDKAFLQWGLAVGILVYLYGIKDLQGPVSLLIFAAFIGLGLIAGDNITAQAKIFWQSIG